MADKPKIFISFRAEDRKIAEKLQETLILASAQALEIELFTELQGGTEWRKWVEEHLQKAEVFIFIYTDERAGWRWCLYEIGVFRGIHKNARKILCIKDPDIESIPGPLSETIWYDGDVSGCKKLITELVYEEGIFNKQINPDFHTNRAIQRIFKDYTKQLAAKFNPLTETIYLAPRLSINLSQVFSDPEEDGADREIVYVGNGNRVELFKIEDAVLFGNKALEVLELEGASSKWQHLFDKYQQTNEASWLNEIKELVESNRERANADIEQPGRGNAENDVVPFNGLRPLSTFTTPSGKQFTPVISRFEYFRRRRDENNQIMPEGDILRKVFLTFVETNMATNNFHDLRAMFQDADISIYTPACIYEFKWKKMSGGGCYLPEDLIGKVKVSQFNQKFVDMFDFFQGNEPPGYRAGGVEVTAEFIMEQIEKLTHPEHYKLLVDEQARLTKRIIFEFNDDESEVPIQFDGRHRKVIFRNQTYMPEMIAKEVIGDKSKPHTMLMLVSYAKDFLPLPALKEINAAK